MDRFDSHETENQKTHNDEEALKTQYEGRSKADLIVELIRHQMDDSDLSRQALFAHATSEGLIVHDQGKITDANDAACNILGLDQHKLVGRGVHEFVSGGWRERITTTTDRFDGKPVEAIWLRANGSAFLCECCNNVMEHHGKNVSLIRFREVRSNRQGLEERLRLAEEMWDLYNNSPCGYHSLDENGLILRMNATELSWLGYSPGEVVGSMRLSQLLTARSADYFESVFPEFKRHGFINELELEFVRRDGSIYPALLSSTAVYDGVGQFVMSRTTVFEISELRRTTKDLQESEEKFRAIAEQSLLGIFIMQEGRIIYANDSFKRISGYSAQELFDMREQGFFHLIDERDRVSAERALNRVMLEGQKMTPRDLRGKHKSGQMRWLEISANQVMFRGNRSLFGMVADITQKKVAEREKEVALSRAVKHQSTITRMATLVEVIDGDLEGALRQICTLSADVLQAERTSIWLLDEKETELHCRMFYESSLGAHAIPDVKFQAMEITHYFEALSGGRAIVSSDRSNHKLGANPQVSHRDGEIPSMLDAAIRLSGKIVGAFCVEDNAKERVWGPDEMSFAGEVADQVAHAIMNARRRATEEKLRKTENHVRTLNKRLQKRLKEGDEKLHEVQHQLVENSRRVGAADMATSVLHNVGNILTSVITSGQTIEKTVRTTSLRSMAKANKLLAEVVDKSHPRAGALTDFYNTLQDLLDKEHQEINENVELVLKKIDLIRDVIMAQQTYASSDSAMEQVSIVEVVEDALSIQEHMLGRNDITTERIYNDVPPIVIPKIQIIHVLINLIKNAQEAMEKVDEEERILTLWIGHVGDMVEVRIRDRGMGISPANLAQLFKHGFSTKKDGHGFGLHSCAVALEEIGGKIHAESEGEGQGATFIVSLPIERDDTLELTLDEEV